MSEQNIKLFKHQASGVDFLIKNKGCGALFWDMGLGKTTAALYAFVQIRKNINRKIRLLVFCPLSLVNAAWGSDIDKFFPDLKWVDCHRKGFPLGFDVYICNYEMLISKKNNLEIQKLISRQSDQDAQTMCVLDESSKIKNFKAETTKELLRLKKNFICRVVMSATPAPNDMSEYWTQMSFVDDSLLQNNFYAFRNTYFHLSRGNQKMIPNGSFISREQAREIFSKGWKYDITLQKREELIKRISPRCHYAKKEDCLDLPDQVDEIRLVEMGTNQKRIYKQMSRDAITEIENNDIVAQVALTKLMKLRQITSGFALTPEGEAINIEENPKLKELLEILEQAGDNQIIIWANFHHEIRTILNALGDKATAIYGEVSNKDDAIEQFKTGQKQYLVAHPKSAAHGLTFVNCSIQVFFSLDYSWEGYYQAKGRIHRYGQVNKCTYIHLLCNESIDEQIYKVLLNKNSAVELVRLFLDERKESKNKHLQDDKERLSQSVVLEN